MQHKKVNTWLWFFKRMHLHFEETPYIEGIGRLYKLYPPKFQAHIYDIVENNRLPDTSVFDNYQGYYNPYR